MRGLLSDPKFQSTPACERATLKVRGMYDARMFQSTPACERATYEGNQIAVYSGRFNPRPRVSGRRLADWELPLS